MNKMEIIFTETKLIMTNMAKAKCMNNLPYILWSDINNCKWPRQQLTLELHTEVCKNPINMKNENQIHVVLY